jgi:hypothetical protein
MIALLLSVLFTAQPPAVDRVELNHLVTATGETTLTQLILWESLCHEGRHGSHAQEWRSVAPEQVSVTRGYPTIVRFVHGGNRYAVATYAFRETMTTRDPELADRSEFPVEQRVPYIAEAAK